MTSQITPFWLPNPPGPRAQRRVDILKYLFHLSKEEKNPLLVLPQRDGYTIKCTYTWVSQKKKSLFYEAKPGFAVRPRFMPYRVVSFLLDKGK